MDGVRETWATELWGVTLSTSPAINHVFSLHCSAVVRDSLTDAKLHACRLLFLDPCTTGVGKLGRSKVGLGKLGFGKLGRGTTSKSPLVKVDILIMFQL